MNTRLKVGQIVNLVSGFNLCIVKVLEINPTGVIVQDTDPPFKKFRLNTEGRAIDSSDLGWNDGRIYNDAVPIPGTFEYGPWELAKKPS